MEIPDAAFARWDAAVNDIGQIKTDVALQMQKTDKIEQHMEKNNGIVAGLVTEHHIQKGWLQAMAWIMGITLAIVTAASTVTGIIIAVQQLG